MTLRHAHTADTLASEQTRPAHGSHLPQSSPRLIIVNNGLRDCRGHHYETAIAVAEAAERFGLSPVMAVHRQCPVDLVPEWLTSVPVFRTEYWIAPKGMRAHVRGLLDAALPRLTACAASAVGASLDMRSAWRKYRAARGASDASIGAAHRIAGEQQSLQAFQDDLSQLLNRLQVRASDHVYLPTTHGRELVAVRRLLGELSATNGPTFHLEFRNPLFLGEPHRDELRGWPQAAHDCRAWFRLYRELGVTSRIRLYTDSEPLASEYQRVAKLPFAVLPIPFRSRLFQSCEPTSRPPLRLAFLGEPRDDKGFHWLPKLIERLWRDKSLRNLVELQFQKSIASPSVNPKSVAAVRRLHRYPQNWIFWTGTTGPLVAEEYYGFIARADLVLFPYEPARYRAATSGTLAESVAAGKPCVVPAGTWLAEQLPAGCGETFTDRKTFIEAALQVVRNYESYRQSAALMAPRFLLTHSPDRLVERLLQRSPAARRQRAA
ncbi:MAG: glycosyltransferase [Pirellulales bacterium]